MWSNPSSFFVSLLYLPCFGLGPVYKARFKDSKIAQSTNAIQAQDMGHGPDVTHRLEGVQMFNDLELLSFFSSHIPTVSIINHTFQSLSGN